MRMDPAGAFAHDAAAPDPLLGAALADELVAVTVQLSELAYDLCSEPETLRRHMDSLQVVDAITQAQLAIADILRSDAPVAQRLAAVTLEALKHRLQRRVLAAGEG